MFIVTVPYEESLAIGQRLKVSAYSPIFPYGLDWFPTDKLPAFTAHVVHQPLSKHLLNDQLRVTETVPVTFGQSVAPLGVVTLNDSPMWNLVKSETVPVNGERYIQPIDIPPNETYVTNASTGDGKSYAIQKFVREKMRSEGVRVIHLCSYIAQIVTETAAYSQQMPGLQGDSTYDPVDDVYDKYYINQCKNEYRRAH